MSSNILNINRWIMPYIPVGVKVNDGTASTDKDREEED